MSAQDDQQATVAPAVPRAPAPPSHRTRQDVLDLVRTEGAATVGSLAQRTGLHENTLRAHLDRLVTEGRLVREAEDRRTRGRPRFVYRAVADPDGDRPGDDAGPARRLDEAVARAGLTRVLLDGYGTGTTDVAATATAAGARLLDELPDLPDPARAPDPGAPAQHRALAAHLDRLGFDPVADPDGRTYRLWRCPFVDLARSRPEVVCAVHLGLAQAVLDRTGGPLRAERLVPFAGPRRCDLHVGPAA